ncbi:hypothetical protein B0H34DRAFT_706410 [Crassisporium funariophilum]|nr:hypothetical protein B0H34DRAFT_706410 [Crassisporium funariophilum]
MQNGTCPDHSMAFCSPQTLIVIYEKDLFDYRHGEPPEHLLTVLRALDIADPYVLRILINQAHIETQILAPTRREAQVTLQGLRGGGSAWSLDRFSVRVFPEGGVASSPLNLRPLGGAMNLLLTGRDSVSDIRHFTEMKAKCEAEWVVVNQRVNMMRAQYNELRRNVDRLQQEENQAQSAARAAKGRLSNLQQEVNEDLPANMQGLEAAKEEAEAEKENLMAQFTDVRKQKNEVDEAQKNLMQELKDVKALLEAFEEQRTVLSDRAQNAGVDRLNAQNNKNHYERKYADEKKKVEAVEAAAKVLQEEFANWTEKAAEYCEQVPNPRKPEEVKRHLDSVQKALKEREKRHGASVEDMAKEVNKAKEQLDKAEKELRQMSRLNKALKSSLLVRLARWQEFRRHIALRCKHVFQTHLSQRGYYGKILFNHTLSTLTLRVQTDDQLQTQGTKDKDPRSLSGGEKSFSTICLLLSLWESIGCPLRCLDEFDVFMDAVNRRISMKMMIDTANTSDRKQYILITPQDMTNVHLGPTVRVLRMSDPERGNGMLPFASTTA